MSDLLLFVEVVYRSINRETDANIGLFKLTNSKKMLTQITCVKFN